MNDLIIIALTLVVSMYIVYFLVNKYATMSPYYIIEGLENNSSSASTAAVAGSGAAGSAATYGNTIKSLTVKMQDEHLVPKYRKDYENIIINMDDYVNMLMLKQVLNLNLNNADDKSNIEAITKIATLKSAKDALNDVMKFVDKQ